MLIRKILAINLAPLALFLVAIYMVYDLRPNLITAKVDSLVARARLVALSIENSDVMHDLENINPTRLDLPPGQVGLFPSSQLGNEWPPDDESPLDARQQLVDSWKRHIAFLDLENDVEIQLFDPVTMESLGGEARSSVQVEEMAGSVKKEKKGWTIPSGREILDFWLALSQGDPDVGRFGVSSGPTDLLGAAIKGGESYVVYQTGTNDMQFMIAVPVRKNLYQTVVGVLLLSSVLTPDELNLLRRQEVIMLLALVAFALTALLSFWLARVITRPLEELSKAATDVRRGRAGSNGIPDLRGRSDEIGRLAEALIKMTRSLERRVEDGKEIARNSAHEIRNAVMGMGGAIMYLGKIDATNRKAMFDLALEETGRLERLADDMQVLSKLDDLILRTPTTIVDFADLLRKHADPDIWKAKHRVTLRHGPGLGVDSPTERYLVDGLEDRLIQVVLNLLSNAASFSPPAGEITVDCRREGGWVEVSICDRGPGIPKGAEEKIFEWLEERRGPGAKDDHSGIGLTISRQIVHAFGGEIVACNIGTDPDNPEGACFTVRLPAASNGRPRILGALKLVPGSRRQSAPAMPLENPVSTAHDVGVNPG